MIRAMQGLAAATASVLLWSCSTPSEPAGEPLPADSFVVDVLEDVQVAGPYDVPKLTSTDSGFEVTWWPSGCVRPETVTVRSDESQLLVQATKESECLAIDTQVVVQITAANGAFTKATLESVPE